MQHLRLNIADSPLEGGPKAQGDRGIDEPQLHRNASQPGRVVRQRLAVNERMAINALVALGLHQVRQKRFHASTVWREEFADVQYAQGHGGFSGAFLVPRWGLGIHHGHALIQSPQLTLQLGLGDV